MKNSIGENELYFALELFETGIQLIPGNADVLDEIRDVGSGVIGFGVLNHSHVHIDGHDLSALQALIDNCGHIARSTTDVQHNVKPELEIEICC